MTDINQLRQQVKKYEADIDSARAVKDFDLVEEIYNQMIPLQDKLEVFEREIKYQQELQEMIDYYDDEKNIDAYNLRMCEMLLSE
jgi:hypothetical protein